MLTVTALYALVTHTLPSALRSRAALRKALKCGSAAHQHARRTSNSKEAP